MGEILAAYAVPHPPMIIPDIGHEGRAQIEKTVKAYEEVAMKVAALKPDTIIITSPHATMYSDYFHISPGTGAVGDMSSFRAPQVEFDEEYDAGLRDLICDMAKERDFPAGTLGEREPELDHGTMVPLWFIRNVYKGGKIIRIGLSGLPLTDHYRLGMMIAEAVGKLDRRVVFIASGDLSHKLKDYGPYGFAPEGPEYDAKIMDVFKRAAFGEMLEFSEEFLNKAAECGHRSFAIMAGTFDRKDVTSEVYSHEDVTGVGYGICEFVPLSGSDNAGRAFLERRIDELAAAYEKADEYVSLAHRTIEEYVINGRVIDVPEGISGELTSRRAGAFVSVHKDGMLRGCIGTILPTRKNLAEEIIQNAISAVSKDPRFDAVTPDEVKWLEIDVDVLTAPEKIASKDELDVKRYGVIVTSGYKRGLLLPDLEGVDDVDEQVSIAMRKGGISPGDNYSLERFEVIRHKLRG